MPSTYGNIHLIIGYHNSPSLLVGLYFPSYQERKDWGLFLAQPSRALLPEIQQTACPHPLRL
jgi:hypothetical protein